MMPNAAVPDERRGAAELIQEDRTRRSRLKRRSFGRQEDA